MHRERALPLVVSGFPDDSAITTASIEPHGKEVGSGWSLRSFQPKPFCGSMSLWIRLNLNSVLGVDGTQWSPHVWPILVSLLGENYWKAKHASRTGSRKFNAVLWIIVFQVCFFYSFLSPPAWFCSTPHQTYNWFWCGIQPWFFCLESCIWWEEPVPRRNLWLWTKGNATLWAMCSWWQDKKR